MRRRRLQPLAILAVLIAIAAFQLFDRHEAAPNGTAPEVPSIGTSAAPEAPAAARQREPTHPSRTPASSGARLDAIDPAERPQVEKTLGLIARGGPFLHPQDGSIFSNRERRLPQKPHGYYREYTVETPGAGNRGARRIVRGEEGETFYTSDHYGTFVRIDSPASAGGAVVPPNPRQP